MIWLSVLLGDPFCGCPWNKSLLILGSMLVPLLFGNARIMDFRTIFTPRRLVGNEEIRYRDYSGASIGATLAIQSLIPY